jgi:hypothetical protein
VASHPTAADAQGYFDSWIDFYRFPPDLAVDIDYGFDTYKVTYCTVDVAPPRPTVATGSLSVPGKAGPLSTVAYLHVTSVSFYDAPSNPDVFGEFNENGESFDGPPWSALFAGGGFIYVAPDYLGLGVPAGAGASTGRRDGHGHGHGRRGPRRRAVPPVGARRRDHGDAPTHRDVVAGP